MDILNFTLTILGVAGFIVAASGLIISIRGHILSHPSSSSSPHNESAFVGCLITVAIVLIGFFSIGYGFYYFNPQNIYSRNTFGVPILADALSTQDNYRWMVGQECYFSDGAFHVLQTQSKFSMVCLAQATNFRNFAFQAEMSINHGGGGILFRAYSYENLYSYFLYQDGYYRLELDKNNTTLKNLSEGKVAINSDQFNLLSVIAIGNSIYLYINRQFVALVNDDSFAYGEIGVTASSNSDVVFENAQVWEL